MGRLLLVCRSRVHRQSHDGLTKEAGAPVSQVRRALIGAVLLDLAVSPLFIWSAFSGPLSAEIGVPSSALSLAYAVGLGAFTAGVLVGGWLADRVAAQVLALVVAAVVVAGLVLTGIAQSPGTVVAGYGVLLGGATGVGYATAVRVAASVAGRRGSALALVVSAYAAGAVVLAPVVDVLWDRVGRTATFGCLPGCLGRSCSSRVRYSRAHADLRTHLELRGLGCRSAPTAFRSLGGGWCSPSAAPRH